VPNLLTPCRKCRSPARQRIKMEWNKDLQEYLSQPHTPPIIKHHLCHGLFSWLETGRYQPISIAPETTDKSHLYALRQQNKIGWQHFARGWMTIEWGYQLNWHSKQAIHKINAEQWGASILVINWKYILKIWNQRNDEVHGTSPEQTERFRQKSMIEEIQYIQSGRHNILFDIRNLINHSLEDLKKLSIKSLEAYLYGAKQCHLIMSNKSNQFQPTLHQILTQMPPQFHMDPIAKSKLDPGEIS
jgi:hypothetical protein